MSANFWPSQSLDFVYNLYFNDVDLILKQIIVIIGIQVGEIGSVLFIGLHLDILGEGGHPGVRQK